MDLIVTVGSASQINDRDELQGAKEELNSSNPTIGLYRQVGRDRLRISEGQLNIMLVPNPQLVRTVRSYSLEDR
jgi:hypothetical protein